MFQQSKWIRVIASRHHSLINISHLPLGECELHITGLSKTRLVNSFIRIMNFDNNNNLNMVKFTGCQWNFLVILTYIKCLNRLLLCYNGVCMHGASHLIWAYYLEKPSIKRKVHMWLTYANANIISIVLCHWVLSQCQRPTANGWWISTEK